MPHLEAVVYHRGRVSVASLPLRGVVGIGRDAEQGIVIAAAAVSRRHATLTVDGDHAIVEDEGSANGTSVIRGGGRDVAAMNASTTTAGTMLPVKGPTEVGVGDVICIGPAVLELRIAAGRDASAMAALGRMVEQIAPSAIRVVLLGETGVGKEVFAESVHAHSPRAGRPLVKVHCGALSETLLESELFGHEKGAFTGAVRARVGLVEAAHQGTLFLDEVGEMTPATQVKLLRVLEDGRVQPVGSSETRQVDVRVVSATHRELGKEVKAGRFRQDLYFRLNGITLRIPPLRERRDEIAMLAVELLARAARHAGRPPPILDDGAKARLLGHAWPGNVRELRQVMERALALCTGDRIDADQVLIDEPPPSSRAATPVPMGGTLRETLEAVERRRIEEALEASGGNQSQAAEMLGMPRRTLVERLRGWGMTRARAKPPT